MLKFLMLAGLVFSLAIFPGSAAEKPSNTSGMKIVDEAGNPVEVGGSVSTFTKTFELKSVPANAKIKISFVLENKGICSISYVPTTIWVNKEEIESIDFREEPLGSSQTISVDVPDGLLHVGENSFGIVTGLCDYEFDQMDIAEVKLRS